MASEGAWLEDWTGGLVLSQRQTRMQQLDLSPGEHGTAEGERWLLRADAQYAYRPQGSVGLGMTLVRQNGAGSSTGSLGPSSRYPESSRAGSLEPLVSQAYSWLDDTDYMTFSGYGEFHDLPAVGEGAGTYMDGQIRWMLADDAVYRVDLGACTYIPVSSGPSSTTCYTRAAWEKNWGSPWHQPFPCVSRCRLPTSIVSRFGVDETCGFRRNRAFLASLYPPCTTGGLPFYRYPARHRV